ncbi:MAG: thioredoxin domain-containing protein, partial [Myxococcales bacterium]|nr:thioredoxin domain-containing protein [Myxococcales bacterium]
VEFSDFQCPFCSRVNPAMKQIKETYPNDVRIVFRQLPLPMHKQAQPAARAALAADRQGKFWEMHDKLFENQKAFSDESFKAWATELGMDAGKFEKDYNDPVIAKMIADDMTVSSKFGARGTPAFFVNGRFINGARPFEQFDALIKEEKAKAEKFMKEKGVPAAKVYDEMLKGWETELKQPPIADHQRRDVATAGLPVKGNAKSPKVTIVECSDFDCPYCQRATDTVKQIMDKYGNEVAFYFRHFPLPMHKNAEPAHRAAIAAQKQGDDKFWAMHDKLFADRKSRDDESLKAVATELGLNVAKWEQDFKDPATAQRVKDDMAACGKLGVRGAPGFFINGRLLSGARPFPQFEAVIKEELAGGFEKAAAAKPDGK